MAKKLALVVVLLALLGGGGYVAVTRLGLIPAPLTEPAETVAEAPTEPAPPAPLTLPGLDATLLPADGWDLVPEAPEAALVPGGQAIVLKPDAAATLPLLLVGRLAAETLEKIDPAAYPPAFLKDLRTRLEALQPPPEIRTAGPLTTPPAGLVRAEELVAVGAFPELGVERAEGRFRCGVTAAGQVYVVLGFAAEGSPAVGQLEAMLASLTVAEAPTETVPAEAPESGQP